MLRSALAALLDRGRLRPSFPTGGSQIGPALESLMPMKTLSLADQWSLVFYVPLNQIFLLTSDWYERRWCG